MLSPKAYSFIRVFCSKAFPERFLPGALTRRQDLGVVLRLYYLALLRWGCWETIVTDHGSQFTSAAFRQTNRRLGVTHHLYDKGRPWQSLIESQFGIQARLGEYAWSHCGSVERAVDIHRDLIRDHNRLPLFARIVNVMIRNTRRSKGFVRLGKWKVYVEERLPRTPVQVLFWDGKLRAEYREKVLSEYDGKRSDERHGVINLKPGIHYETEYSSRQQELFDVNWLRDPIENLSRERSVKRLLEEEYYQPKLNFGEAA